MFGQFLTGGVIRPFDINSIDLSDKEKKYNQCIPSQKREKRIKM